MQGMKGTTMPTTITNVAKLSDEVKSGQIHGVIQLYKLLDEKPALEKKPADIFARTYLTDALRTALDQIRCKFTGQDQRGSLVFTGGYGSGKSHQLLALYHTLTHPDLVAQWLSRHGYDEPLPRLDDLAVIVLHTARVDYDNLWEPVFQQLNAQDVLKQVKRYPTIPQIRQALADRPVVIIIDEIENWY
jgi:predicted ATPase